MSTVINCKSIHLRQNGYSSLLAWLDASPDHLYIGRDMTRFVAGSVGSKWQNPYKSRDYADQPGATLLHYEAHVRRSGLLDDIMELEGKVLGCWCKPDPCHGDVLMRLLAERKGMEKDIGFGEGTIIVLFPARRE